MNTKEKVVRKLLGKCECSSKEKGCFVECPDEKGMHCSRDVNHKGKHYACGASGLHKIYEW